MIIIDTILPIFHKLFPNMKQQISMDTLLSDIPGWDSLSHANLIMELEILLKKNVDISKAYEVENVSDLINLF